jgi:hypothetical protein
MVVAQKVFMKGFDEAPPVFDAAIMGVLRSKANSTRLTGLPKPILRQFRCAAATSLTWQLHPRKISFSSCGLLREAHRSDGAHRRVNRDRAIARPTRAPPMRNPTTVVTSSAT